jgi:hypothetical protein
MGDGGLFLWPNLHKRINKKWLNYYRKAHTKNIAEQFNTRQSEIKFVRDQYLKGGAIGLIPHKPGHKAVNDLGDVEKEVLS